MEVLRKSLGAKAGGARPRRPRRTSRSRPPARQRRKRRGEEGGGEKATAARPHEGGRDEEGRAKKTRETRAARQKPRRRSGRMPRSAPEDACAQGAAAGDRAAGHPRATARGARATGRRTCGSAATRYRPDDAASRLLARRARVRAAGAHQARPDPLPRADVAVHAAALADRPLTLFRWPAGIDGAAVAPEAPGAGAAGIRREREDLLRD